MLPVSLLLAVSALSASPTASPDPKTLAVPEEEVAQARELVVKLGSSLFRDRERASEELRKMGRRAIPALTTGLDADDSEVRLRCEVLLPLAEADELDARTAAFLADKDLKYKHDLPGWEKFVALTDGDPATRQFYADMLRNPASRQIFSGLSKGKEEFARRLTARQYQIQQAIYPRYDVNGIRVNASEVVSPIDFGTLMFGSILSQANKTDVKNPATFNWLINMLYQPAFRQAIEGQKESAVLRKLLIGWCDTWTDANGLQMAMYVTQNLNMKESARYAEKIVRAEGGNAWNKSQALCNLARFGGKEKLPVLESLFEDKGAMPRGGNQAAMEVRDIALIMAITVTGKKPADYGYTVQNYGGELNDQMRYNPWIYTIANEKTRETAFKKWKDEKSKDVSKK